MNKHLSVLIIDDEITTRAVLKARLVDRDGYRVHETDNGLDGVKIAAKELPHVILLDWMMPGTDGIETLKLLRKNKKTKNIPVYMLTAKKMMEDADEAFSLGAEGYLTKPIALNVVSARVRKAILKERTKRAKLAKRPVAA